jgi:tyrosyl-tRNA synthetase
LVEYRAKYYQFVITELLKAVGVPIEKLTFVLGSSYQYNKDYTQDMYKLSALTSAHDAKKAGAEVVKQTDAAPLSGLLYPILQVLDEQYLDVDIQFGGMVGPPPRMV